jgi:hypothetical protein
MFRKHCDNSANSRLRKVFILTSLPRLPILLFERWVSSILYTIVDGSAIGRLQSETERKMGLAPSG